MNLYSGWLFENMLHKRSIEHPSPRTHKHTLCLFKDNFSPPHCLFSKVRLAGIYFGPFSIGTQPVERGDKRLHFQSQLFTLMGPCWLGNH